MNIYLLIVLSSLTSIQSKAEPFTPSLIHKTYTTYVKPRQTVRSRIHTRLVNPRDIVKDYVTNELGLTRNDYVIKDSYQSDSTKVTHFYLRQIVQDMEVFNGDMNINVHPDGHIISVGNSFYQLDSKGREPVELPNFPESIISASDAMKSLLQHLDVNSNLDNIIEKDQDFSSDNSLKLMNVPGAVQEPKAQLGWIQVNDELEPTWDLKLDMFKDYYHAHISIKDNKSLLSLINWSHSASYRAIPLRMNDPSEGERWLLENPHDIIASPLGWHQTSNETYTDTAGNNVIAVSVTAEDPLELDPSVRVDGGNELKFDFPFDDSESPENYKNASITNLFYVNNIIHDLYYKYGFDEKSGNFQQDNFGKGGLGNDSVIAHSQDPSFTNNAFFTTPPDGEHGHMQMFIFDVKNPNVDGDFDNGIMIHEYTHGLSTRLTGGPSNSDCLGDDEPGGLGEGWGDAIATMIRTRTTDSRKTDYGMGGYVGDKPTIRRYLYSTNMTTNPDIYSYLNYKSYQEVHVIGAVWANILYEVYWNLIDQFGFTIDWLKWNGHSSTKFGNTLMLQLIIDGMKLQPCSPNFIDARDAILLAESLLTKGKARCSIWKGFAKRGLGVKAELNSDDSKIIRIDSFEVPEDC